MNGELGGILPERREMTITQLEEDELQKRQQIRLIKGLQGYPLQSINPKLLDMGEEVATAVAIPSRNIIVCIDVGYRSPSCDFFPKEENLHLISISDSPVRLSDNIPRETVDTLEALLLLLEDIDEEYRSMMEDYRDKVLEYLRISERVRNHLAQIGIKDIFKKSNKIEKEKNQLAEVVKNLTKNYTGKRIDASHQVYVCLSRWALMVNRRRSHYHKILTTLSQIKEPWSDLIDLLKILTRADPRFIYTAPYVDIHINIMSAITKIYNIFRASAGYFNRIINIRPILPTIIGSFNWMVFGEFPFFTFVIPVDGEPRIAYSTYYFSSDSIRGKESSLILSDILSDLKEHECGISDGISKSTEISIPKIDPNRPSTVVKFWIGQYMKFHEIIASLEEKAMKGKFSCPYCEIVYEICPELKCILKNGFFLSNNADIISVLFEAAETLPFYLEEELSKIERNFILHI
jgi:hypothetical protein